MHTWNFTGNLKMHKKILLSSILAFIFHTIIIFFGVFPLSFDAYTHMFFASHYVNSWFNLWEPRWYGGFSIASYTPLTHQILALFSLALKNYEYAYALLTLILLTLTPIIVYSFTKNFFEEKVAVTSAIIAPFIPSIATTIYAYGQLPTLMSSLLTILGASFLHQYLKHHKKLNLLVAVLTTSSALTAHHLTSIFVLFLTLSTYIFNLKKDNIKTVTIKFLVFLALTSIITFAALHPFILFTLNFKGQAEIPHFSRDNIFFNIDYVTSIISMYSFTIFLLPQIIYTAYKTKNIQPLLFVALISLIFGFGGTTPIPKLVFQKYFETLIYDRFNYWTNLMLLPYISILLVKLEEDGIKLKKFFKKLFIVGLIVSTIIISQSVVLLHFQPLSLDVEVDKAAEYLNNNNAEKWSYLTLGLCSYFDKFSLEVNSTTQDGSYYIARTNPVLRESGIERIDGAKFFKNGIKVLRHFLFNADKYHIRWVVCADRVYDKLLEEYGFKPSKTFGKIVIWEKPGVPPIKIQKKELICYEWGIIPPVILTLNLTLICYSYMRNRWSKS